VLGHFLAALCIAEPHVQRDPDGMIRYSQWRIILSLWWLHDSAL